MKVLIVDDQVDAVKDIFSHCKENQWEPRLSSFDEFDDMLNTFDPDVIVLDWKDDANGELKGESIFEKIWATGFKPIIIFSAYADGITLDEKYRASNLIKLQTKGDEAPVIQYLDEICPYVPTITNLKDDFNVALIQALNAIGIMNVSQPLSPNIIRYVFAKRVSNYFDNECDEEVIPPWIQYTYPAISGTLSVCDIIRSIPSDGEILKIGNPEEYKIVLSPSCDMAHGKIPFVLCADCYDKNTFYKRDPAHRDASDLAKFIKSKLNLGYNNRWVPLPGISEVFPFTTVDLKMTKFIALEEIALWPQNISSTHKFSRITSIDSPYREQIVWAHMINSCRPGVPDRDMDVWAKELMQP